MITTLQRISVSNLEPMVTIDSSIAQFTPPIYAFLSIQGNSCPELGLDMMKRQAFALHQLGLELAQYGCQIDIFIRREHPNQPEIIEHRPGCRTICLTAGPAQVIPRSQLPEYLPAFVEAWLAFQRRSHRHYALVQTNDWLSGWVGLHLRQYLGLPLVHTSWTIGELKYLWPQSHKTVSIRYSVERACLEQADCVVVGSPQEVVDLRQMLSMQGRSKVIPFGADIEHFGKLSQASARQQLGISIRSGIILHVGGFAPLKGIETLLKACTLLPSNSFKLYLVNSSSDDELDTDEQQQIKTLVQQMHLENTVVFAGAVPRSQLPAYYAAANVCVIPSYHEASGSVVLESMASGTPIIASAMTHNVGELRYLMRHDEMGLLVPPFKPSDLATAIWDALANPRRWRAYGLTGQHWVRSRFSYAAVATQMYDLYRSITLATSPKAVKLPQHSKRPGRFVIH